MMKEIGKLRGEKGELEDSILALQKKTLDIFFVFFCHFPFVLIYFIQNSVGCFLMRFL